MIKIRKVSDLSDLTIPARGYATTFVDKDEQLKVIINDKTGVKVQSLLQPSVSTEDNYLQPINAIVATAADAPSSVTVGYRVFSTSEFSILQWNGTEWESHSLKDKTAWAYILDSDGLIITFCNNNHYITSSGSNHTINYKNPHRVTKEQVGLGQVLNEEQANEAQWLEHVNNTNNPHSVTKEQVGLGQVLNVLSVDEAIWTGHVNNKNNPHGTTKEDVGLGNIKNIHHVSESDLQNHTHSIQGLLEDLGLDKLGNQNWAVYQEVDEHINNTDNPHGVTKADVGLDVVDNIKPYSRTEFLHHVEDKNNPHAVTKADVGLELVLDGVQLTPKSEYNNHLSAINPHGVTKEQVGLGHVLNIEGSLRKEDFDSHLIVKNPHLISARNVGLEMIQNARLAPKSELVQHEKNTNPHGLTKEQIGLANVENVRQTTTTEYNEHLSAINPHMVTKEQLGLGAVLNEESVDQATVDQHTSNYANPHYVTKVQIGLANVENVADVDYPVTDAQKAMLDNKYERIIPAAEQGVLRIRDLTFPIGFKRDNYDKIIPINSPTGQYMGGKKSLIFNRDKHGSVTITGSPIGNDLLGIVKSKLQSSVNNYHNIISIGGQLNDTAKYGFNGITPVYTSCRRSKVHSYINKFFKSSSESAANFSHHRINSFDTDGLISYIYDSRHPELMIRLNTYNGDMSYYHNNPLNTFCDLSRLLYLENGSIIGIPRENSNYLVLIDFNKSGTDKYQYIPFYRTGSIVAQYLQIVKEHPTQNRVVIIERTNSGYNAWNMVISDGSVHTIITSLSIVHTVNTKEIIKFSVSSTGLHYVLNGKCYMYSFNDNKLIDHSAQLNGITAVEFYKYDTLYFVLHSNYKALSVLSSNDDNSINLEIAKLNVPQNCGINGISMIKTSGGKKLLKISTGNWFLIITNRKFNSPFYIYKKVHYGSNTGIVGLTPSTAFDRINNSLLKVTAANPLTTAVDTPTVFSGYNKADYSNFIINRTIKEFKYNLESIDVVEDEACAVYNPKTKDLLIIRETIDPSHVNDAINKTTITNQEYISDSKTDSMYCHDGKFYNYGINKNYKMCWRSDGQIVDLDDSALESFIIREKSNKDSWNGSMIDEFDFRLLKELPVKGIRKAVRIDYTENASIAKKNSSFGTISIKNGMLLLLEGGKIGYYDWDTNSMIEKLATKEEKVADRPTLSNHVFPYLKSDQILDVQYLCGQTLIVEKNCCNVFSEYKVTRYPDLNTDATNIKLLGRLLYKNYTAYNNQVDVGLDDSKHEVPFQCENIQFLKGCVYDFRQMKKITVNATNIITLQPIDFPIPTGQEESKLVFIKEVLNGYVLIQIGGNAEVSYNKWTVDFGMTTAIPSQVKRGFSFNFL